MTPTPFADPLGRWLSRLSWAMAIAGTLVITGLAVMLVVTIFARKLLGWQVTGDHELVRMLGAVGVSLMLPWCQIVGGNVMVDLFTSNLRKGGRDTLDRIGSLLLAVMMGVLAWRTGVTVLASLANGSFSPMLAWPIWIFQMAMLPGLFLTSIGALYTALAPGALAAREAQAAQAGVLE